MSDQKKKIQKPEFDLHFVVDDDSGRWFVDYENVVAILRHTADELGSLDSQASVGTAIKVLGDMKAAVEQAVPMPEGQTQH